MSLATQWAGIMAPSGSTVLVSFFAMNTFCSSPASQAAGVRFNNDGTVDVRGAGCSGVFTFEQNFLSVGGFAGAADDFEIRCAPEIGLEPTSGDSIDVFLPLTSNRSWSWNGFGDFDSGSWVMFVREIADPSGNFDFADYDFDIEDGS
jgi:hypothetical protein